tara:strand:+ start:179 stop:652 length:474 start_codon:yes stop_codon:yes gene_type:complete
MNKPVKTYTPLMSEVLTKVNNAKTKDKKIAVLKEHDSEPLRMLIKASFDPNIEWVLPEGNVPFKANEAPEGTEHTLLSQEVRKIWHFIKGADNQTPRMKKETMFIQMLEGLHKSEAEVLCHVKDKVLHQKYKGLSDNVVKTAFGWEDNYWMSNGNII